MTLTFFRHCDDLDDACRPLRLHGPIDDPPILLDEMLANVLDHLDADEAIERALPFRLLEGLAEVHVVDGDSVIESGGSNTLSSEHCLLSREGNSVDGTGRHGLGGEN